MLKSKNSSSSMTNFKWMNLITNYVETTPGISNYTLIPGKLLTISWHIFV
jgi:hypothetical protein